MGSVSSGGGGFLDAGAGHDSGKTPLGGSEPTFAGVQHLQEERDAAAAQAKGPEASRVRTAPVAAIHRCCRCLPAGRWPASKAETASPQPSSTFDATSRKEGVSADVAVGEGPGAVISPHLTREISFSRRCLESATSSDLEDILQAARGHAPHSDLVDRLWSKLESSDQSFHWERASSASSSPDGARRGLQAEEEAAAAEKSDRHAPLHIVAVDISASPLAGAQPGGGSPALPQQALAVPSSEAADADPEPEREPQREPPSEYSGSAAASLVPATSLSVSGSAAVAAASRGHGSSDDITAAVALPLMQEAASPAVEDRGDSAAQKDGDAACGSLRSGEAEVDDSGGASREKAARGVDAAQRGGVNTTGDIPCNPPSERRGQATHAMNRRRAGGAAKGAVTEGPAAVDTVSAEATAARGDRETPAKAAAGGGDEEEFQKSSMPSMSEEHDAAPAPAARPDSGGRARSSSGDSEAFIPAAATKAPPPASQSGSSTMLPEADLEPRGSADKGPTVVGQMQDSSGGVAYSDGESSSSSSSSADEDQASSSDDDDVGGVQVKDPAEAEDEPLPPPSSTSELPFRGANAGPADGSGAAAPSENPHQAAAQGAPAKASPAASSAERRRGASGGLFGMLTGSSREKSTAASTACSVQNAATADMNAAGNAGKDANDMGEDVRRPTLSRGSSSEDAPQGSGGSAEGLLSLSQVGNAADAAEEKDAALGSNTGSDDLATVSKEEDAEASRPMPMSPKVTSYFPTPRSLAASAAAGARGLGYAMRRGRMDTSTSVSTPGDETPSTLSVSSSAPTPAAVEAKASLTVVTADAVLADEHSSEMVAGADAGSESSPASTPAAADGKTSQKGRAARHARSNALLSSLSNFSDSKKVPRGTSAPADPARGAEVRTKAQRATAAAATLASAVGEAVTRGRWVTSSRAEADAADIPSLPEDSMLMTKEATATTSVTSLHSKPGAGRSASPEPDCVSDAPPRDRGTRSMSGNGTGDGEWAFQRIPPPISEEGSSLPVSGQMSETRSGQVSEAEPLCELQEAPMEADHLRLSLPTPAAATAAATASVVVATAAAKAPEPPVASSRSGANEEALVTIKTTCAAVPLSCREKPPSRYRSRPGSGSDNKKVDLPGRTDASSNSTSPVPRTARVRPRAASVPVEEVVTAPARSAQQAVSAPTVVLGQVRRSSEPATVEPVATTKIANGDLRMAQDAMVTLCASELSDAAALETSKDMSPLASTTWATSQASHGMDVATMPTQRLEAALATSPQLELEATMPRGLRLQSFDDAARGSARCASDDTVLIGDTVRHSGQLERTLETPLHTSHAALDADGERGCAAAAEEEGTFAEIELDEAEAELERELLELEEKRLGLRLGMRALKKPAALGSDCGAGEDATDAMRDFPEVSNRVAAIEAKLNAGPVIEDDLEEVELCDSVSVPPHRGAEDDASTIATRPPLHNEEQSAPTVRNTLNLAAFAKLNHSREDDAGWHGDVIPTSALRHDKSLRPHSCSSTASTPQQSARGCGDRTMVLTMVAPACTNRSQLSSPAASAASSRRGSESRVRRPPKDAGAAAARRLQAHTSPYELRGSVRPDQQLPGAVQGSQRRSPDAAAPKTRSRPPPSPSGGVSRSGQHPRVGAASAGQGPVLIGTTVPRGTNLQLPRQQAAGRPRQGARSGSAQSRH
eukprot:TRINITY_DN11202_c0_g2_i1.p1 TRINITY_DN11202_c0_g2~~TRINITY_DN11202_c0_g2_i1.p1  ORF type:complete len:1681 (+),score=384.88 TRINITY_DN11202_c0_g2_i1:196-5238(+)